jgi:hypothetical protein
MQGMFDKPFGSFFILFYFIFLNINKKLFDMI